MAGMVECPRCEAEVSDRFLHCPRCGQRIAKDDLGDPLVGRVIADKYLVQAPLGSGAMGCVYRSEHIALDRRVALKVLHTHLAKDKTVVQRFMREAKAASRLSHPNIVTLLDFGQEKEDRLLYLVMEFLDGRSLGQILEIEGPVDLRRAMLLARQVLLAIDEAHAKQIVHRDLKPDNIIVQPTRHGEEALKVVDFGIAHIIGAGELKLTATGHVFGTPNYLSPEQARSIEVGPASDIYSFGTILFELATGRLPFLAETVFEMLNKHVSEPPPHPAQLAPHRGISEELSAVILRCLKKDPDQRFGSAMEVHRALSDILEGRAAEVSAHDRAPPAAAPEPVAVPLPPLEPPAPGEVLCCSACNTPIAPDARFCGTCGMPSAVGPGSCPACGASCQPNERFCTSCGAVLASMATGAIARPEPTQQPVAAAICSSCGGQLSATEPTCSRCGEANPAAMQEHTLEHLRKYIPQGVMDAILQARHELATQRRQVSVVFADVSGFTSLSEEQDPEDVVRLMNRCFEGLVQAVHMHGGTVDKFIGDCVMAVFGVPVAHEDDPERAVRAAFEMFSALEQLNRSLPFRLDLRIGINTGPVVAGAVGSTARLNYTVMGDTVNVAQRLEAAAEVGKILVSEPTYQACHKAVEFKPLPPLRLKGKKKRVMAYEAVRLHDLPQAAQVVTAAVLVGRTSERQAIEEAGRRALEGTGSALLLTGEPGIGKSALLMHAAGSLSQIGLRTHVVRARLHSGRSGTFAAVLGSLLDCSADAEAEQVRAQITALGPKVLDATDQQVLTDLTLAGEVEGMAQDTVQLAIATAVRRLLRVTASREPTAILIDDVRQLPDRERTLLATAAAATRDTALLVVVADRDTALHTWPHQQYRRIEIGPLGADEAERLLRKLAGDRTVRPETIPVILDYSGGNPLYLVETVHLLDAQGHLTTQSPRERGAPSIKVPDGIKPLVLARFDALEPPAKRALIYAAVVGRSFTLGLLSRLAGDARILSITLEALCDKGLLEHETAGKGQVRMRFRHELVREVLYDLTTRKTRTTIHDEVATLLLAKTGGGALPEEIARHLELAGRDAEAADLFEKAGNDRAHRQQSAESAAFYHRAAAALERAQSVGMTRGGDASGRDVTLRIKLARALNSSSQWAEAGRVALVARNTAQQAGDIASTARASRQLARAASEQGKLSEAFSLLREAYHAALECGDLTLSADLASDLGEVQERVGDLEAAMKTLLGALDTLETATSRSRFTQTTAASSKVAEVLNRLGRVALRAGMRDKATRYLEGALEQARTAGDQGLAARVLGNLGQARAMAGDVDAAFEALEAALETAQGMGDRLGVAKLLYNQARLHLGAGHRERAEALARESFDLSVEIGWREGEAMGAAFLEQVTARSTV